MSLEEKKTNKKDTNDPFYEEFLRCLPLFHDRLSDESERGTAIVAAALMDDALQNLLQAKLVPSCERNDELFSGAYAPLSNFSAKIDFAYRVGLIGLEMRGSLHLIRKIRNEFAHSSTDITFEYRPVYSRIRELFKLNQNLLDATWEVVKKEDHPQINQLLRGFESKQSVDYLVKIMSWSGAFRFVSSIISSQLQALHKVVEPLKHRKTKEENHNNSIEGTD